MRLNCKVNKKNDTLCECRKYFKTFKAYSQQNTVIHKGLYSLYSVVSNIFSKIYSDATHKKESYDAIAPFDYIWN